MTFLIHRGEPHEYTEVESGLQLFSVTQIRRCAYDAFAHVPADVLEATRRRGKSLHMRFALMLLARAGVCPHPDLILGLEAYCVAMDEWAERNQVRPVRVEEPSLNRKYGYAGTPDCLIRYGQRQVLTLTDLKTGEQICTDAMQLYLYKAMDGYEDSKVLLDLYIDESGRYREIERKPDPHVWAGAMAAIQLLKWRTAL